MNLNKMCLQLQMVWKLGWLDNHYVYIPVVDVTYQHSRSLFSASDDHYYYCIVVRVREKKMHTARKLVWYQRTPGQEAPGPSRVNFMIECNAGSREVVLNDSQVNSASQDNWI